MGKGIAGGAAEVDLPDVPGRGEVKEVGGLFLNTEEKPRGGSGKE